MNGQDWKQMFNQEIKNSGIQDKWELCVDEDLLRLDDWLCYKTQIFGSFHCSQCRCSWSSSKVFVLFFMKLYKPWRRGDVRMRIFKQECKNCPYSVMKEPVIHRENIKRAISNLVRRIQKKCYGMYDPNEDLGYRNFGKSDGPHEEEHCEACLNGLCDAERMKSNSAYGTWSQPKEVQKEEEASSSLSYLFGALAVGVVAAGALAWGLSNANDEKEEKKNKK